MYHTNLLPPLQKEAIKQNKANSILISWMIVILFIMIVGFLVTFFINMDYKSEINSLTINLDAQKEENKEYSNLEKELLALRSRGSLIEILQKDKIGWAGVIQEILNLKPVDVTIDKISLQENKISLDGSATSRKVIGAFQEKIENSSFFDSVDFHTSTLIAPEKNNLLSDFNLTFNFVGTNEKNK